MANPCESVPGTLSGSRGAVQIFAHPHLHCIVVEVHRIGSFLLHASWKASLWELLELPVAQRYCSAAVDVARPASKSIEHGSGYSTTAHAWQKTKASWNTASSCRRSQMLHNSKHKKDIIQKSLNK